MMATTSIWKVDHHLTRVVDYAKNAEKTANPEWTADELQALRDVMDYAMQDYKTEKQFYVTGLNCEPAIARDQMQMTKRQFHKENGILAFHGYQSFAPGETTAEQAHRIGVELAQRLWPDFQVIVATHLNTKCYHNHFVLNSVSFEHGKKFNNCKETYTLMRRISDDLCRKYQLSVVTEFNGRSKHYAEWKAENERKPTWRGLIREDVDTALKASMSFQTFLHNLREQGYEIKTGVKYLTVRPPGKERFVRLRSLGECYTEEAIRQRILNQRKPERPPKPAPAVFKQAKYKGSFFTMHKVTWKGLRALYFHYVYLLRQARQSPQYEAAFLLREDLIHMDSITAQAKLLAKNNINTAEQLNEYRSNVESQISELSAVRKSLTNEKKSTKDEGRKSELAQKISAISGQLKVFRREVSLCNEILVRSIVIQEKLEQVNQQNIKEKELKEHEPGSRRGRPDREHGA